ncbi:MAG: site-specific DNA-methyltransferase [Methanotrichaceae archaeon]|jgi:site-specific DNA-methyltransferase (adenine-specific)
MLELDRIYCGDCLSLMREIPDKFVDLTVTDPPFNAGIEYDSYDDSQPKEKYFAWLKERWTEIRRVSKGILITPGSKNFLDFIERVERPKWVCSWGKTNQNSPSPLDGYNAWEPVLVYGDVKLGTDFWNIPIVAHQKGVGDHPCPKLLKFWEKLVLAAQENSIVLDPFAGSGTTAVACKRWNRRYICIDVSENYCETARDRVKKIVVPSDGNLLISALMDVMKDHDGEWCGTATELLEDLNKNCLNHPEKLPVDSTRLSLSLNRLGHQNGIIIERGRQGNDKIIKITYAK